MINQDDVSSKRHGGLISQVAAHLLNTKKEAALVAGLVFLFAAIGAANAQTGSTPTAQPADSSTGITQATSADHGMQCATGYALSGGSCVLLSSMLSPPSCPAGQILSGATCIPPSNFFPVVQTCPAGQILSGGACAPVIDCPAGLVLSNNVCIPWGTGGLSFCSPQPVQTQYLGCPSPQLGSITQHNVGTTCDPATHVWAMSGWTTSDNTCTTPAGCPTPKVVNWSEWGNSCIGTVHYLGDYAPVPSGTVVSVQNVDSGFDGLAQATCNNGAYTTVGTCTVYVEPPPPPPPPPSCIESASAPLGQMCGYASPSGCMDYGPWWSNSMWIPSYNCISMADAVLLRPRWCSEHGKPPDC